MDKSLMIFIAVGVGFLYFVTHFINGLQDDEESLQNSSYKKSRNYAQYKTVDSIGQTILDFTDVDEKTQIDVWNQSSLKKEFLELFPDFLAMKDFVDDRLVGKALQNKLKKQIKRVEDRFISGEITADDAKRQLRNIR